MPFDRAIHDAFIEAGLRVKHVGLDFANGCKLIAEGWHSDGMPFRFVSGTFSGNAILAFARAQAKKLVADHAAASAQPSSSEDLSMSGLSKLGSVGERIRSLKQNLDSGADALAQRADDVEKRAEKALAGHENIVKQTEAEVEKLEDDLNQISNGAPGE